MNLISQLAQKGLLEEEKVKSLLEEVKKTGRKEEEILLEKKMVSEELLFSLKSSILNIPFKTVYTDDIALEVLEIIPEEAASNYKMIPIFKKEQTIGIGMVYPEDLKAKGALDFFARQKKLKYEVFLIPLSDFHEVLKKYKSLKKEVSQALGGIEEDKKERFLEEEKPEFKEEAPISKTVDVILRHAVEGKASDIHIEPGEERLRVRFRLDGILRSSIFLPMKLQPALVSRIKIICGLKIDETRVPQDGRLSVNIDDKKIDFRISTFPTTLGEKVVIRILDSSGGAVSLEDAGVIERNLKVLEQAIKKPYGMILVTGPTGSGKTTTLYSILEKLNIEGVNIVTLEDPVEYFLQGISQSQVKPDIGYTFASGLRSILRQDPDIVMVGEIRDKETASLAVNAALTGHIMLSTLHTNNVFGVIPRLVDMGIEPFLISASLNVAIAQRLARKLCSSCKKKVEKNSEVEKTVLKELEDLPPTIKKKVDFSKMYICQSVGCKKCGGQGYKGRIGVFEILEMTDQLSEIIVRDYSEAKIEQEAVRQGMITMRQDALLKVLKGVTSYEEVLRITKEN
ncbi:MAG: ATPase, T2SS/T4P/T4SS family [Candidatus Pacebacteria bacterium]|nr:ATPase, T2SS/T4P/T4SS family [Candidatus Paceibacterota bacterium]